MWKWKFRKSIIFPSRESLKHNTLLIFKHSISFQLEFPVNIVYELAVSQTLQNFHQIVSYFLKTWWRDMLFRYLAHFQYNIKTVDFVYLWIVQLIRIFVLTVRTSEFSPHDHNGFIHIRNGILRRSHIILWPCINTIVVLFFVIVIPVSDVVEDCMFLSNLELLRNFYTSIQLNDIAKSLLLIAKVNRIWKILQPLWPFK